MTISSETLNKFSSIPCYHYYLLFRIQNYQSTLTSISLLHLISWWIHFSSLLEIQNQFQFLNKVSFLSHSLIHSLFLNTLCTIIVVKQKLILSCYCYYWNEFWFSWDYRYWINIIICLLFIMIVFHDELSYTQYGKI